jgi:hypothetical protein
MQQQPFLCRKPMIEILSNLCPLLSFLLSEALLQEPGGASARSELPSYGIMTAEPFLRVITRHVMETAYQVRG